MGEELISPYVRRLLSVELTELGNSTLCRHPLEASKFNWGREIAFLIMGEMSGGGEDVSREPPRGRATEFLRTWWKARVKKPAILELLVESGLPGGRRPPKLLRKEVSPNTSPPRPTCIVCLKSPNGGLIMSTESSLLKRRFSWEPDVRPFIPGSFPRLMVIQSCSMSFKSVGIVWRLVSCYKCKFKCSVTGWIILSLNCCYSSIFCLGLDLSHRVLVWIHSFCITSFFH